MVAEFESILNVPKRLINSVVIMHAKCALIGTSGLNQLPKYGWILNEISCANVVYLPKMLTADSRCVNITKCLQALFCFVVFC